MSLKSRYSYPFPAQTVARRGCVYRPEKTMSEIQSDKDRRIALREWAKAQNVDLCGTDTDRLADLVDLAVALVAPAGDNEFGVGPDSAKLAVPAVRSSLRKVANAASALDATLAEAIAGEAWTDNIDTLKLVIDRVMSSDPGRVFGFEEIVKIAEAIELLANLSVPAGRPGPIPVPTGVDEIVAAVCLYRHEQGLSLQYDFTPL
jgi:hypothetical protein